MFDARHCLVQSVPWGKHHPHQLGRTMYGECFDANSTGHLGSLTESLMWVIDEYFTCVCGQHFLAFCHPELLI